MRNVLTSTLAAAALAVRAVPLSLAPVDAMPLAQPLPLAGEAPAVILASGGCGPFAHRGFYGGCRPNGFYGGGYRRFGYGGYGYRRFGYGYGRFHRF